MNRGGEIEAGIWSGYANPAISISRILHSPLLAGGDLWPVPDWRSAAVSVACSPVKRLRRLRLYLRPSLFCLTLLYIPSLPLGEAVLSWLGMGAVRNCVLFVSTDKAIMAARPPLRSFMRLSTYWTVLDDCWSTSVQLSDPDNTKTSYSCLIKVLIAPGTATSQSHCLNSTLTLQRSHVGGVTSARLYMHSVCLLCDTGFHSTVALNSHSGSHRESVHTEVGVWSVMADLTTLA